MLSAIFNYPLVACGLHILIEPPPTCQHVSRPPLYTEPGFIISSVPFVAQATLSLHCLILGEPRECIFTVEIVSSESVSFLRKAIKEEDQYTLRNVAANQLILYRTSLPNDDKLENKLKYLDFNETLQPTSILAKIFTDPPMEDHLDIIVRLPPKVQEKAGMNTKRGNIFMAMNDSLMRTLHRDDTLMVMDEFLGCTIAPSSILASQEARSSTYFTNQKDDGNILDCRCASGGFDTVAPPIQIFNPASAYFTSKAFDPEHVVPRAFLCNVLELVESSAAMRPEGFQCENYLKHFIQKILGHPTMAVSDDDGITLHDMVVVPYEQRRYACLVIYVEMGELGDGGSDPSTLATFIYRRIFRRNDTRSLVLTTCCPVFIVACAGPWLSILGRCDYYKVHRAATYRLYLAPCPLCMR